MNVALTIFVVFAALVLVPIPVYGTLSAVTGIDVHDEDFSAFLSGIAISKIGTAIAFVGLWLMVRYDQADRIWTYVFFWWLMFLLGEIGRALRPDYSLAEAFAGILSATIALPLSGLLLHPFLRE